LGAPLDKISSDDLLPVARKEGVDFVPGSKFFPTTFRAMIDAAHFVLHCRKNEQGIKRLGTAIEQPVRIDKINHSRACAMLGFVGSKHPVMKMSESSDCCHFER
jgi:hypothetical protein